MSGFIARIRRAATGSVLRQNISFTLGRQLLAAVAQLLLVVFIARQLGPAGNGQYAMGILIPTLLANFLNLGVGSSTVYHVGRGEYSAHQALKENFLLGLEVAAAGTFIALPVLYFWAHALFPNVPLRILLIGLAAFPVSLLLAYFNTILQGLEDFRAFNATILLPPYVTLAGVWLSLYILHLPVIWALISFLIGQIAGLIAAVGFLARKLKHQPQITPSLSDYRKKILSYGWKAHLANIMAFVNYRADIFIVNFFLNPAATGLYVVAVQISERLWMLSRAASTVLLPRLSAMSNDPEGRLALTHKGFLGVLTITAAVGTVAAIALYWLLVPIFGEDYKNVFPAFLWLLPGIIAGAGARVQANCIAAAGKPQWNMYAAVGLITLNIVGNIVLVPTYGILGAAWATSATYFLNALLKYYLVNSKL